MTPECDYSDSGSSRRSISHSKAETPESDMTVEVVEQPTGSFSVGAGFSNLENFVFTAKYFQEQLSWAWLHYLSLPMFQGPVSRGTYRFYDPYFLDHAGPFGQWLGLSQ